MALNFNLDQIQKQADENTRTQKTIAEMMVDIAGTMKAIESHLDAISYTLSVLEVKNRHEN